MEPAKTALECSGRPFCAGKSTEREGRGRDNQERDFSRAWRGVPPKGASAKKRRVSEPTTIPPAGSRGCPHTPWQGVKGGSAPPSGGPGVSPGVCR